MTNDHAIKLPYYRCQIFFLLWIYLLSLLLTKSTSNKQTKNLHYFSNRTKFSITEISIEFSNGENGGFRRTILGETFGTHGRDDGLWNNNNRVLCSSHVWIRWVRKQKPDLSMVISAYRWILLKSDSDTRMAGINVSVFFVIIQGLGWNHRRVTSIPSILTVFIVISCCVAITAVIIFEWRSQISGFINLVSARSKLTVVL